MYPNDKINLETMKMIQTCLYAYFQVGPQLQCKQTFDGGFSLCFVLIFW